MPHLGRFDAGGMSSRNAVTTTAGTSPYTYTAPCDGVIIVTGASISNIQYSRGSTSTTMGVAAGAFPVRGGDGIKISWLITAPTITFIPN